MSHGIVELNRFVTSQDVDARRWLLLAVREGFFSRVTLSAEPSWIEQLGRAVRSAPQTDQERWKEAACTALGEWAPEHGPRSLFDLAHVCLEIRAASCVAILRNLLLSEDLAREEFDQTRAELVYVLAGFTPLPDAKRALDRLFWNDDFDPHCAGLLFVGLCACVPNEFARFLRRFFELEERCLKFFDGARAVLLEAYDLVGLSTINECLVSLSTEELDRVATTILSGEEGLVFDADVGGAVHGSFRIADPEVPVETSLSDRMSLQSVLIEVREYEQMSRSGVDSCSVLREDFDRIEREVG